MNNLSCFIVDDEQSAIDTISAMLRRYCPFLIVAGSAVSVTLALDFLENHIVDIIFLDIKMKQETGFDLLKKMPSNGSHIIFVTAHDQYGIQAIKFSALDYLLKPIGVDDLIAAVHKVNQTKNSQQEQITMLIQSYQQQKLNVQKRIALPDQSEIRYVLIENIVCCMSDNSYTSFYVKGDTRPLMVSKAISEYEHILMPYGFVRIHQSWLININHIESLKKADGGYLVMNNKMIVPVSRQRKHLLKEFSLK